MAALLNPAVPRSRYYFITQHVAYLGHGIVCRVVRLLLYKFGFGFGSDLELLT